MAKSTWDKLKEANTWFHLEKHDYVIDKNIFRLAFALILVFAVVAYLQDGKYALLGGWTFKEPNSSQVEGYINSMGETTTKCTFNPVMNMTTCMNTDNIMDYDKAIKDTYIPVKLHWLTLNLWWIALIIFLLAWIINHYRNNKGKSMLHPFMKMGKKLENTEGDINEKGNKE